MPEHFFGAILLAGSKVLSRAIFRQRIFLIQLYYVVICQCRQTSEGPFTVFSSWLATCIVARSCETCAHSNTMTGFGGDSVKQTALSPPLANPTAGCPDFAHQLSRQLSQIFCASHQSLNTGRTLSHDASLPSSQFQHHSTPSPTLRRPICSIASTPSSVLSS